MYPQNNYKPLNIQVLMPNSLNIF